MHQAHSTKRRWLLAATALTLAAAPVSAHNPGHAAPAVGAAATEVDGGTIGAWGVDQTAMKTHVDPGDDFFAYVNGAWLDSFEIPADRSNFGAFTALQELSERRVRTIVEDAASGSSPRSAGMTKVADYYAAYTDRDRIEARGLAPAHPDLAAISAATSHADIVRLMGDPELGLTPIIAPFVDVDAKRPDRYVLHISHAGLGMPNRDFYIEEAYAETKAAYEQHVAAMLSLSGQRDAAAAAQKIVALETAMAELHWPLTRIRNLTERYNLRSRSDFLEAVGDYPWEAFEDQLGLPEYDELVVLQPDAIAALARLFMATDVATWRDFLRYHYLSSNASVLPDAFLQENFAFYGTRLEGQTEQAPLWRRGVNAVSQSLGDAIGQEYVARHFPASSKAAMDALIGNIRMAYDQRIRSLDWMSDATKQEALAKLEGFEAYIGHPDEWRDYAELSVRRDDAFGNLKRSRRYEFNDQLADLGGPVDPANEWGMNATTVNAYYSPVRNAIYFPAAILQPPFFDPAADPAVNYGAIGAVIGHEIGHGFDDQGRKTDGGGLLRDWWTGGDAERFAGLTGKLGAQFATYEPLPGMFIDPQLTMGENVGDLGGVNVALHAYKLSLEGGSAPELDGYSGIQRFFLAYAQVWRRKHREADMRMRMSADPHSPAEFRVNGIVRNIDDWYTAFSVEPGDDLYLPPEERVSIW